MIEIIDIKIIDHAIIPKIDQTIKDHNKLTIKIDHATIHRTEIQVITTDKETNLNRQLITSITFKL